MNNIAALMQGKNISIVESNTPRYDCHANRAGQCPHKHKYSSPPRNNRHMCKDCDDANLMSTEFKAEKPKFPAPFKIKDIAVYSQKLKAKDHMKYKDL